MEFNLFNLFWIFLNGLPEDKAGAIAEALSCGQWTHDYPTEKSNKTAAISTAK